MRQQATTAEDERLEITRTQLPGVLVIKPPTLFEDHRGQFVETYNKQIYYDAGIDIEFVQDDISVSRRHVLRGIHGDRTTWKLVTCLKGAVYHVVVDCDASSSTYRRWQSFALSEKSRLQVLIPPRFGNAHLTLTDEAVFQYKQSAYYDREGQFTRLWNDPELDIWWPVTNPILSPRDEGIDSRLGHTGSEGNKDGA